MQVVDVEVNVGTAVCRLEFDFDSEENRRHAERVLGSYRYVKHFRPWPMESGILISQGYWGLD